LNKTILLTTIIAIIAVGATSAYAANLDLKADTTVTGNLAVTGDITGPTITALTTAISSAAVCPLENTFHWDKIIFFPQIEMQNFEMPPLEPVMLSQLLTYDIKVLDDPDSVAFLEGKLVAKLNDLGYGISGQPATKGMLNPLTDVAILDVDYAIICSEPPV